MKMRSMTGFGQATVENDNIQAKAEIKSLNGKFLDVKCWLPRSFYSREIELRNKLNPMLERGSVSINVYFERLDQAIDSNNIKVQTSLAQAYHSKLKELADTLGESSEDLLKHVLKLPDVLIVPEDDSTEQEWELIINLCLEAYKKFNLFREEEGESVKNHLAQCIRDIQSNFDDVKSEMEMRKDALQERIYGRIKETIEESLIDKNRFEQELIYYLEKYDIAEEIQRLDKHLNYFLECLGSNPSGKKLGFISQEIGREINTLGVKSNHFPMQKSIVNMKESLEQIKEQVLNIM
jgi:uncharacterized protein (TIGR00255 family)